MGERMFTVELTASKTYYKKASMEIEASSLDEAKKKVQNMTTSELEGLEWTIYDADNLEVSEDDIEIEEL